MSENTNHQYSMVGIFMLKIGERMKIKDMERLTHKRENGIKRGYWSPNKKQELVDRLAMYEDREDAKDTMSLANGFHVVNGCRTMKVTYWYHLRMQQCWISQDMKKMMKAVHSIREMMKNLIQAMEYL